MSDVVLEMTLEENEWLALFPDTPFEEGERKELSIGAGYVRFFPSL